MSNVSRLSRLAASNIKAGTISKQFIPSPNCLAYFGCLYRTNVNHTWCSLICPSLESVQISIKKTSTLRPWYLSNFFWKHRHLMYFLWMKVLLRQGCLCTTYLNRLCSFTNIRPAFRNIYIDDKTHFVSLLWRHFERREKNISASQ